MTIDSFPLLERPRRGRNRLALLLRPTGVAEPATSFPPPLAASVEMLNAASLPPSANPLGSSSSKLSIVPALERRFAFPLPCLLIAIAAPLSPPSLHSDGSSESGVSCPGVGPPRSPRKPRRSPASLPAPQVEEEVTLRSGGRCCRRSATGEEGPDMGLLRMVRRRMSISACLSSPVRTEARTLETGMKGSASLA